MNVLIACEYSGRVREAFRARGHNVISCDFEPAEDGSPHHYQGDVFQLLKEIDTPDLMIAHPPCTYLCNSGVRWLWDITPGLTKGQFEPKRHAQMEKAAKFFADLLALPIPKIAIENPIMHRHGVEAIRNFHGVWIRQHFVQPWWFGDEAFKATGFTLKVLDPLVKPATALVPPKPGTPEHKAWSQVHNASPGPNRWKERSRTYQGIANAMATSWG